MFANEICIFWSVESAYNAARAAGASDTARQEINELWGMAMHSTNPRLRLRMLRTIRDAATDDNAPRIVRRAALEALAALDA